MGIGVLGSANCQEKSTMNNINHPFGFPITPFELKIEITRACNLRCTFCYLGHTQTWSRKEHMPEDEVFKWIDWAADNDIPAVRFTGGEPTLHPGIKMFCNYAHLRKRWIFLNTNGMARESLYDDCLVHDLRVSVPSLDPGRMADLTRGGAGVLDKKLAVIKRSLDAGNRRVSMLTALTPELIGRLEGFVQLQQELPGLNWLPLRLEASPERPRPLMRTQIQALAEEMADLMDRYPEHVGGIALAAPFCSVKPTSLGAKVFRGKIKNCGPHVALNVNFDSKLSACFGVCEFLEAGTLEDLKKSKQLHACCSLEALPEECRACEYVQRCAGGCRKPAGLVEHNGKRIDYLAGFVADDR